MIESKKKLEIDIPNLKQNLEINFDKESTLESLSGNLKLNIFDSVLLINFKGKDEFEISKSFIRNKSLNSKIDGKISFKNPFNFNIDLDINQIDVSKLLKSYPIFQSGKISKKLNGILNVNIKAIETLFGKAKNVNMQLNFQNGDIKINNIRADLPFESNLNSSISLLLNDNKPKLKYKGQFTSDRADKFLRKFGVYDFEPKKQHFTRKGP